MIELNLDNKKTLNNYCNNYLVMPEYCYSTLQRDFSIFHGYCQGNKYFNVIFKV